MLIASYFINKSHRDANDEPVKLFGDSMRLRILLFTRSLVGFGGISFAFLAVEKLPIGDSTTLVMLSPVFSAILATCVLSEPWLLPEFIATVVSLVGAAFVAKPSFIFGSSFESLDPVGVVYGLSAALSAAGAYVCVRMLGTSHKMPWANVCLAQALGQMVFSLPFAPIFGQKLTLNLSGKQLLILMIQAPLGAMSQVAMTIGMQKEKSATATAMRSSDIVFAFLWQILFTRDGGPDSLSIFGSFLIVGSILIIIIYKRSQLAKNNNSHLQDGRENVHVKDGIINYEMIENPMDVSQRNGDDDANDDGPNVGGTIYNPFEYKVVIKDVEDDPDDYEIELSQETKEIGSLIHYGPTVNMENENDATSSITDNGMSSIVDNDPTTDTINCVEIGSGSLNSNGYDINVVSVHCDSDNEEILGGTVVAGDTDGVGARDSSNSNIGDSIVSKVDDY